MSIGKRIKDLRKKYNISQVDLALTIDVSKQTMYKYENDIITNIPSDKIELMAEALHTTPAYLMGWTLDPHDWAKIGNEEGIYPPKEYEGSYEDYVKFKIMKESDDLCDTYWETYNRAIQYLRSINCKIQEEKTSDKIIITTPIGEKLIADTNDLVANYIIFGSTQLGIKKLVGHCNQNSELSEDEVQLLHDYSQLNDIGQKEALKRVSELTLIPSYTRDKKVITRSFGETSYSTPQAAHERTDIEVTDEMRKHDNDLMDNEDLWK